MTSANAIGVILNERRLNRLCHFSGEIDQVVGTSSGGLVHRTLDSLPAPGSGGGR